MTRWNSQWLQWDHKNKRFVVLNQKTLSCILCDRSEEQIWSCCLKGLKCATFHSLLFWKWAIIKTKQNYSRKYYSILVPLAKVKRSFAQEQRVRYGHKVGIYCRDFFPKTVSSAQLRVGFTINNAIHLFIHHRMQSKLYSTGTNCHKTCNSPCLQGDDLPPESSKILLRFK